MIINHVLSCDKRSAIFDAIFDYFRRYAGPAVTTRVTMQPIDDAAVYHYHRPHLELALRSPAVVTVHHDLRDPDPWLKLDDFIVRYREAQCIACLNSGQAKELARLGLHRTTVIPHGYNSDVLGPRAKPVRREPKVTLGLFSKYYERRFKGEAYLHELVKRLDPQQFRFVLVGEQRLVTADRLLQLGFEVSLFEYLPYRLFQSLYESIDYLLMCSNFEGGPANLPEAFATGTPVLAAPVGLAPDFIEDGDNGLILTGDSNVDAARLAQLVDPRDPLAARVIEGAMGLRAAIPTWKNVVERYLSVYNTLGSSHATPSISLS